MLTYKIVLPKADNNGKNFNNKTFSKLLAEAQRLGIEGGSLYKPTTDFIGFWYNEQGKLYQENNGFLEVSGSIAIKPAMRKLAEYAKKLFKQEAIYFSIVKAEVNFI